MTIMLAENRPIQVAGCYVVVSVTNGADTITFQADDMGNGFKVLDLQGVTVPPVELESRAIADGDGDLDLSQRLSAREVFIAGRIRGRSEPEVYAARQRLVRLLRPGRGTVDVVLHRPDTGQSRRFRGGFYQSGLEGDFSKTAASHHHFDTPLKIRFSDPLAYGDTQAERWALSPDVEPWLSETLPFLGRARLFPSSVVGSRTLTNEGELPASVRFDVTGPGTDLLLTNTTTDETFELLGPIVAPTRIERTRVRKILEDGVTSRADLWSRVPKGRKWLSLAPGPNPIKAVMVGMTDESAIDVTWSSTYWAGL